MWAEAFAQALGAKVDESAHPVSGPRTEADEMVGWPYLLEETGRDRAPLPRGTIPTQSLNHLEATEWSGASLLGAWCHDEKGPTFVTFLPGILVVPWMIELLSWSANSRTEWARGPLLPFQMALPLN